MSLYYLYYSMKIFKSIIIFLFFISSLQYAQLNNSTFYFNTKKELLKKHLHVLGSDLFEGRGTGTKGSELAANYIAAVYRSLNLTPIGNDNSFFQNIQLHGTSILDESKLVIYSNKDTLELKVGTDYILSNSGEQTIIPQAIELVFKGYGIIAPEFDHNDYLVNNVTGKIAVILGGEPESEYLEYFNGDEQTIYSHIDAKHRIAISRGAAGTIIIPQIDINDSTSWNKLVAEYSFEDVTLSYNASNSFGIILNPKMAQKIFALNIANSELLFNNINTEEYSITFEGEFFVRDFISDNVVGMIKAKDKNAKDGYIIISAHYDHLGIGMEVNGDKIYNGVLDNGIGVSALLEVAREIKLKEQYLKRNIIFIATTGEEKGLLGSQYYVDHPIFPLYKTVANVNIDGIAFLDEFKSIIGIGAELSNLSKILNKTASIYNLDIVKIPKEFYLNESFNRSDQISFAKAGIPSILILDSPDFVNHDRNTGIEKIIDYNTGIYHTPFDDLSIEINYDGAILHTNFLCNFIFNLAYSDCEIKWNKNVTYNYMRLKTIAEKR